MQRSFLTLLIFIQKGNNQCPGNILQERDTMHQVHFLSLNTVHTHILKFMEEIKIGRKKPNLIKRNEIYF
jgi:hypothetical protein